MAKTLAELVAGEDMEGGEAFCDTVYNNLKNHWRAAAAPATPSPGMQYSSSVGEKLYHRQAAAWEEIIQTATPVSDDAQIIIGDDSDILIYYDEAGNDELMIEARNAAATEGITVSLLETNQRFRIRQNSDVILIYHDGTDAYLEWTGTDLNLLPPAAGAVVIDGVANNLRAGLDIINLGTATIGIDLSNSGLAGGADYWIYNSANNYWSADGMLKTSFKVETGYASIGTSNPLVVSGDGFRCQIAATNEVIIFTDRQQHQKNYGRAAQVHPTFYIQSNTDPAVSQIEWGSFAFIGTGAGGGYFNIGTGVGDIALMPVGNVGIGTSTFGANAVNAYAQATDTAPTTSPADMFQMWSADILSVAGKAGPHWRAEEGGQYAWHGLAGTINCFTYQGDVADDGTFNLPAITDSAWGFIQAGDNEEYALFMVDDDGDVTLISNSANVVANADTDGKICLGIASPEEPLTIRNRLGAQKNINLIIWYS